VETSQKDNNSMKAMILEKPGAVESSPLRLAELPSPDPKSGEIRISIRACGVCHTDLHTVEGDLTLPRLPIVPGHQIVGIVDHCGSEVSRFEKGQRVGVPWLFDTCGECEYCGSGRENLCPQARFTGYHENGGYAEEVVVGENYAYPRPAGITDSEAAPLLCAGIIGYRALRMSEARAGTRIGLFGFGGSAHITIQVARHWDCEVYVFTRSRGHQRLARQLGAKWVGRAEETPPSSIQSAIIFAPAGSIVPLALSHLDRGGTLALAGVTMTPIPVLDYDSLLYWERSVRSVANFTRKDAEELLKLAEEIPIQTTVHEFPLESANEALLALKESRIDGTGVLAIDL
jgi:propanol-preferring alcohol dehydrogenase